MNINGMNQLLTGNYCLREKDSFKVNAPVCDPVSFCGYSFVFSSIDEANDEKPYDNHYKNYPE